MNPEGEKLETLAPLRAEAAARAEPARVRGPTLPPPRNRLKEKLLALVGRKPSARTPPRCPTGACG